MANRDCPMANILAPLGLTPVRRVDGAAWTGNQSQRLIAAANTHHFYQGDVVKSLNTGYIDTAAVVGGGAQIAGIFVGCHYLSSGQSRWVWSNQFPGSDTTADVIAYIIDDPGCVFLAQTGGASGSAIGISAVGNNVNFSTTTAGNALNGLSGMAIDDNTVGVTTTLPFRVVAVPGISDVPTGGPGLGGAVNGYDTTTKYNVVLVAFNNVDYRSLTGI